MVKTSVKFQKNRSKTVGGVAHTRYIHAYPQRVVKTSVKFQKNRSKTVGGVAHTRYILYRGTERRKDRRTDGQTDERNDGKTKPMSLRFSSKRRGTIKVILVLLVSNEKKTNMTNSGKSTVILHAVYVCCVCSVLNANVIWFFGYKCVMDIDFQSSPCLLPPNTTAV